MSPSVAKPPYQKTKEELLRELGVNSETGLSRGEASSRLLHYGANKLMEERRETLIDRTVNEFKNPLAFLLLCAGIVTTILGVYVDATVIFIALVINVGISLYQEGRADRAFERLRTSQEKFATVIRDGTRQHILAEALVPGDVVVVETGTNVPADLRIFSANNLEVNESLLTGEWREVEKQDTVYEITLSPSERKNILFMGTLVTGGSGVALVVGTGNHTELGRIATALGGKVTLKTPLQENVANVARFILYIIIAALVGIFILGFLRGEPISELLLVSIALAVAAIPEGLPAAATVVLAIGMEALLRRGGLVRNLLAAETLGSTTVILTDKTGTLTKAEMRVQKVVTLGTLLLEGDAAHHAHSDTKEHEVHGDERDTLEFAALASDAYIERCDPNKGGECEVEVRGRPVERAVVLAALDSGLDQSELLRDYPRIDVLPFDSKYRMTLSLHHIRGLKQNRLYVIGAPEYLLTHAGALYLEGKSHANTPQMRERFMQVLKNSASEGMRIIAVGYHDTTIHSFAKGDSESREKLIGGFVLAGLLILHDPLRADVPAAIRLAQEAGTRVIMATGDNPETARAIAAECGIWKAGDHVLTGSDVEGASDSELAKLLKHTSVFARMLPENKMRLVNLLTAQGEVVAMTGDGVNDAPALRAASIGVALGSGTEVAKEASDLILLNNSFSIIVAAIEEGRRIIDNLRKIVVYLLSTSFSEIIVVGGALVVGLPMPLLPAQILWTNMLSEGFMNFAFAFEPKENDLMERNPRISGARMMLSLPLICFIITIGMVSGLLLLGAHWFFITVHELSEGEARTLIFTALTLSATLIAFSLKDLRSSIFKTPLWSNGYLLASLAFALGGLYAALAFLPLSNLLRLVPVDFAKEIYVLLFVILGNLAAVEVAKYILFDRRKKDRSN